MANKPSQRGNTVAELVVTTWEGFGKLLFLYGFDDVRKTDVQSKMSVKNISWYEQQSSTAFKGGLFSALLAEST